MILDPPTDIEKQLIIKFRNQLGDILKSDENRSDHFLIRWIRARDHNLEKSESMIRTSLEWREEFCVDKVLNSNLDPWLRENYPYWTDDYDKLGNVLTHFPLGSWDIRKAINSGRETEFIQYVNQFFETIMENIRKKNNSRKSGEWKSSMWTVIVDWKGYSYCQLIYWKALQNILKIAATYENHYPEIMNKAYFINCPPIFPLFMGMLKSVVAPKTMGKIVVYGSDSKEWEPELLKAIDKDALGTTYGGNKHREEIGNKEQTHVKN